MLTQARHPIAAILSRIATVRQRERVRACIEWLEFGVSSHRRRIEWVQLDESPGQGQAEQVKPLWEEMQ